MSTPTFNGLRFRSIGPAFTSGRVIGFAVDPKNPAKYFAGFLGSTAKPITRPEVKAGPIERKRRPLKVGVDIGSRGVGDSLGLGEALGAGEPLGAGLVEGDGVGTGSWANALRWKSRTTVANSDVANERLTNKRAHLDIS